jgi:heme oxygenase
MQTLLAHLREATAASHASLDDAFGSLDLSQRSDYARFLVGHAIGMRPLFGRFRTFVADQLGLPCPDYPAMLRTDLAALDIDAEDLPKLETKVDLTPGGSGYVVAGSRLGLSMIRKAGYWGRAHGHPSAYMEDDQGIAIWKSVSAWLKRSEADEAVASREAAAAVAAFDTFRDAFAASGVVTISEVAK